MKTPANLKMRLISGGVLILAVTGILFGDDYFHPNAPFLLSSVVLIQCLAVLELVNLLPLAKPHRWLIVASLILITLIVWTTVSTSSFVPKITTWNSLGYSFLMIMSVIFMTLVIEILLFDGQRDSTLRVANAQFMLLYLGVPSIFFVLLRALPQNATFALAATIFVPKLGDVGAYFVGSLIGSHKMTPTLSPKKTWEGFAGGMVVSVLAAIGINQIGPEPLFKNGIPDAAAFGLLVGLAGVFGDLFASMIKRNAQVKDASQSIPGFGGVLDVVDSVLFAAPVAYLFFVL